MRCGFVWVCDWVINQALNKGYLILNARVTKVIER